MSCSCGQVEKQTKIIELQKKKQNSKHNIPLNKETEYAPWQKKKTFGSVKKRKFRLRSQHGNKLNLKIEKTGCLLAKKKKIHNISE